MNGSFLFWTGTMMTPDVSGQEFKRDPVARAQGGSSGADVWESWVRRGTGGALSLHPRLVGSELAAYQGSRVFTIGGEGRPDGPLGGLAVFCRKTLRIRLLPGFHVSLNGYRLAGDQVLGAEDEAVAALLRSAARLLVDREADCLLFEDLACDSLLWNAVHRVAAEQGERIGLFYPYPPQPHYEIRFPDNPSEYWKKFSGKVRYNLRRSAGKFNHRLLMFTSQSDVSTFLDMAHAVSKQSWQSVRLGLRVRNSGEERAYWSRVAELGAFRSYILEHDGIPVAFVMGTCWNGHYTYEEIGFDQAYGEWGPGTILLYRILEDLIAHDTPSVFDFGAGDAGYKRLFSTHQYQSGPILLARRSYPAFCLRIERLSRLSTASMRALARRMGVLELCRRWYRHGLARYTGRAGVPAANSSPEG